MYWSAHLIIPFILISIAIAYFIVILIKKTLISKSFTYATLLIICVSSVLSNLYDFWITFNWDNDTWVHLTLINDTINSGLFSGNPFYPNQPIVVNYSIIHLICAELYFFIEVPPHVVIIPISLLAILLRILFAFVWIRYLLNSEKLGLLAVSVYVFTSGSIFSSTFHFLWYPFCLAITISSLIFLFILKAIKEDKLKYAVISAFFFAIAIMLHLIAGIFIFLAMLSFLFFYFILKGKPEKKTSFYFILFFVVGIGLALIWSSWIVDPSLINRSISLPFSPISISSPNFSNQAEDFTSRWFLIRYIQISQFKIVNPLYLFIYNFNKNLILIGLIIIGFYKFIRDFKIHQSTENEVYLLSNAIVPIVVSFIPPLFYLLNSIVRSFMIRFLIILPQLAFATIGFEWLCIVAFRRFSSVNFKPRFNLVPKNAILLFFMIFLTIGISFLPRYVYYSNREAEMHSNSIFDWSADFKWLKENSDKNSVVLSDPWTSYYVPYFAGRKIVATHGEHSISYPISPPNRISDALLALNISTPIYETLDIIVKYNVSYVLLNLRPFLDANYSDYRSLVENYYTMKTPLKFYNAPKHFRELYYCNGVWIFEVIND